MRPALVYEDCIHQFCFFANGNIHAGMTTRTGIYRLHRAFRRHRRSQAFAIASALAYQGIETVVTVSSQQNHYRVWTDLRSTVIDDLAEAPALLSEPSRSDEMALK